MNANRYLRICINPAFECRLCLPHFSYAQTLKLTVPPYVKRI